MSSMLAPTRRLARAAILITALLAAVFATTPSNAFVNTVVAPPGSAVNPVPYVTPVVAVAAGSQVTFVNADLTAMHDVIATAYGPGTNSWCSLYLKGKCPLFWTPLIPGGATTEVKGANKLASGKQYEFFCTLHPWMEGTLVVQ